MASTFWKLRVGAVPNNSRPVYQSGSDVVWFAEHRDRITNALTAPTDPVAVVYGADGALIDPSPTPSLVSAGIYSIAIEDATDAGVWQIAVNSSGGGVAGDARYFEIKSETPSPAVIGPTAVASVNGIAGPNPVLGLTDIDGVTEVLEQAEAAAVAAGGAAGASAASSFAEAAAASAELSRQNAVSSAAATPRFTTLALLNADLDFAADVLAEVYSDGTNNGLYRKSGASGAGSWTLYSTATIPALDLRATEATASSGELVDGPLVPSVTGVNGGVAIAASGRNMGFSIPSGSSGNSSVIFAQICFTPDEIARLVGQTLRFTMLYDVTAGFATDKPANSVAGTVVRSGTGSANAGTLVSSVQVGTRLTRVVDYTITATDVAFGVVYQVGTSTSTVSTHTIQIVSATWKPMATGALQEVAADTLIRQRIQSLRRLGLGPCLEDCGISVTATNGAATRATAGRNVGFTVPAGSTGNSSLIQPRLLLDRDMRALLTGRTVRVVMGFNTSADFARALTIVAQTGISSGTRNPTVTVARNAQVSSTRRVIDMTFAVTGDETDFRCYVQQGTTAAAASDEYIEITDYTVDIVSAAADGVTLDELHELARRYRLPRATGIGPVWDEALPSATVFNGATLRTSGAYNVGITIPAGSTGVSSLVQARIDFDAADVAALAGRTIKHTLIFDTSADFSRAPTLTGQVRLNTLLTTNRSVVVLRDGQISSTRRVVEFLQAMASDVIALQPFVQITASTTTAGDEWIEIVDWRAEIVATTTDVLTMAEENQRVALRRAARRGAALALEVARDYAEVVNVKADGGGDYETIGAALAAIIDASALKRYLIQVHPGRYDESGLATKDWVDIEGTDRDRCWVRGYLDPDTALGTVASRSTFDMETTTTIRAMRITAQNMRYAIHADDPTNATDRVCVLEDCYLEHFGAQEVVDYQTDTGGSPGSVWGATRPWGSGLASGQTFIFRRCTFRSGVAPWLVHTNGDFERASKARLENCTFITTGTSGDCIFVQPLGSGRADVIEIIGCSGNGAINYQPYDNLSAGASGYLANRAEVAIRGYGNAGLCYVYTDGGERALRIQSASTAEDSAVSVSGSAKTVIFGDTVTEQAGGGLSGAIYGVWDVSGEEAGTTLGARLGDCTGTPKLLEVAVDGAAPVTVTFNADHSAQSNATVLGIINAALGAAATASLMDVTTLFRPSITDEEQPMRNTDTAAIPRRRAAAYQDDGTIRMMTAADPASRFAGIALEDIRPGEVGRVKTRGILRVADDLDRSDSGSFVYGDTFGVGATAGRLVKSPSVPLLTAISAASARFG